MFARSARNIMCLSSAAILSSGLNALATEEGKGWPRVPVPKHCEIRGDPWKSEASFPAVIVTGARAGETERYAAERLQKNLLRITGKSCDIIPETRAPTEGPLRLWIGTFTTHDALRRLCEDKKFSVDGRTVPPDGFLVETVETESGRIVVMAASEARGAIYAQAAWTDTLDKSPPGDVWVPQVSIRDWPDIAWRAFAQNAPEDYLVPGRLDRYVDARLNFLELRDGPPPMRGHFGIPPDFKTNKPLCEQLLREAHRRGFFVYGVVFCGVPSEQHENVLRKVEELASLKVDGIYMSFDDPGSGTDPLALVPRVAALARKLGYTSDRLALLPPIGAYQKAEDPLNRRLAALPECKGICWFLTSVPSEAEAKAALQAGIPDKRGWWFNWPIAGDGALMLAPDYLPLPSLSKGWGKPDYRHLRDAAQYVDHAMVWVRGMDEYLTQVFGMWAWNPKTYDWNVIRPAVYAKLFGAKGVEPAMAFDDTLEELTGLFERRGEGDWKVWVLYLSDPAMRPQAEKHVAHMKTALTRLKESSLESQEIEPGRREEYLKKMQGAVHWAERLLAVDFPEYDPAVKKLRKEMRAHCKAGREKEWLSSREELRARVLSKLDAVRAQLGGRSAAVKCYLDEWSRDWEDRPRARITRPPQ